MYVRTYVCVSCCICLCAAYVYLLLFMSMGWDYVSELQSPTGVLFLPQMIYKYGIPRWNNIDRGTPKNSEKTLSHCHCFHLKSHKNWYGGEPWPSQWEPGDWPPVPWHDLTFHFKQEVIFLTKILKENGRQVRVTDDFLQDETVIEYRARVRLRGARHCYVGNWSVPIHVSSTSSLLRIRLLVVWRFTVIQWYEG
jgi:hypothetical protein